MAFRVKVINYMYFFTVFILTIHSFLDVPMLLVRLFRSRKTLIIRSFSGFIKVRLRFLHFFRSLNRVAELVVQSYLKYHLNTVDIRFKQQPWSVSTLLQQFVFLSWTRLDLEFKGIYVIYTFII